jgi:hypothetical protein
VRYEKGAGYDGRTALLSISCVAFLFLLEDVTTVHKGVIMTTRRRRQEESVIHKRSTIEVHLNFEDQQPLVKHATSQTLESFHRSKDVLLRLLLASKK